MITLKYYKKEECVYLSHIDVLRHLNRTFRRAQIEVGYSSGFNPHMLVNMGVPLPLGISSSAEYVTVDCTLSPEEFLERYNSNCPAGLMGIRAFSVPKNPNMAGKVVYADYSIRAYPGERAAEIDSIINQSTLVVDYPTRKNPDGKRDIMPDICAIKAYADSINVCINALTLRADILSVSFAGQFGIQTDGTEIWRYNQYVRENGVLKSADEYLENLPSNQQDKKS